VFGGTKPGQFIPAVEKGVRDVIDFIAIAGYPLQDVRQIVYDGKYHAVDSKEVAFRAAGKFAFRDAITRPKPVLLEPIVSRAVTVPESQVGTVASDFSPGTGTSRGRNSRPAAWSSSKPSRP
jgi:elongation factor G